MAQDEKLHVRSSDSSQLLFKPATYRYYEIKKFLIMFLISVVLTILLIQNSNVNEPRQRVLAGTELWIHKYHANLQHNNNI